LGSMHRSKGAKMAIWQKSSHFGTFDPVHRFQRFFWPNDFWLSIMKDLLNTFAQKVPQVLSRIVHVIIQVNKLNCFKFPSWDSKKFLFWVAGMILEGWELELE